MYKTKGRETENVPYLLLYSTTTKITRGVTTGTSGKGAEKNYSHNTKKSGPPQVHFFLFVNATDGVRT